MGAELEPLVLVVEPEQADTRLDRYLALVVPDISRSYVQHLISDAHVRVNGKLVKPSYAVQPADEISVTLPLPQPTDIIAENIPLTIVYEDADLLVVDKAAGMVVHPAPGHANGTLVNALLYHYPTMQIGDDLRPGIVHRIDRDTSGLLVVAKNDRAKTHLQTQQQAREMLKIYLALIEGHFKEPQGVIDAPIDRHPTDRLRMAIVQSGRSARTHYRTCEVLGPYSLIEAKLETGRTHQIRVHFTHKHHPVVGDPLYGPRRQTQQLGLKRQFLHAHRLGFTRLDGQWIECTSPLPADLQAVLDQLHARYGDGSAESFDPSQPWWLG
ncbi:MAG: RluA family pseudouridine synthase [Chloroflexi bacterium]|nr:RluA family pseudouridine synthase [Chloroflexota bacterium]